MENKKSKTIWIHEQNATPKLKLLKAYKMINMIDSLKSQRWHITALNGRFTSFHTCQSPFLHTEHVSKQRAGGSSNGSRGWRVCYFQGVIGKTSSWGRSLNFWSLDLEPTLTLNAKLDDSSWKWDHLKFFFFGVTDPFWLQ